MTLLVLFFKVIAATSIKNVYIRTDLRLSIAPSNRRGRNYSPRPYSTLVCASLDQTAKHSVNILELRPARKPDSLRVRTQCKSIQQGSLYLPPVLALICCACGSFSIYDNDGYFNKISGTSNVLASS